MDGGDGGTGWLGRATVEGYSARVAAIDHREVLEQRAAKESMLWLSAFRKLDGGEPSINYCVQGGDVDLCEMDIDLHRPTDTCYQVNINQR